jgi:ribulose-phosphate 3-epimerase
MGEKMKISASIYSNQKKSVVEVVRDLDVFHVDYLHIDSNDDLSVFDDIGSIRKNSKTPIDLHIITNTPEKYYDLIKQHNIEFVTFQHENLEMPFKYPGDLNARLGISFTSDTPIDEFAKYSDVCNFILLMTTTPGQSGGSFDKRTFDRIREFKSKYPYKRVHVDGGVNDEVSFVLRNLGVNCAVSGSYLVNSNNIPEALIQLKKNTYDGEICVKDFMIMPNELPVIVRGKELGVERILRAIGQGKMGFAFIVDEKMELRGVVTDGDMRRALLDNMADLNVIKNLELVNRSPITISADFSVSQMISKIQNHRRPILFLPVTSKEGKLVGVVSFNNLIKGEL